MPRENTKFIVWALACGLVAQVAIACPIVDKYFQLDRRIGGWLPSTLEQVPIYVLLPALLAAWIFGNAAGRGTSARVTRVLLALFTMLDGFIVYIALCKSG